IEHFQALAPGQRKSQRRRRCHFWGEAVRGRGAQPLGGWEARVSGPGGFEKGGHPISANLRVEPSEECDASVPR
ncbi:hypothetical protein DSD87_25565, partial [Salmonella enterica]|nr:hypothetical protein [Salmonella enterica]